MTTTELNIMRKKQMKEQGYVYAGVSQYTGEAMTKINGMLRVWFLRCAWCRDEGMASPCAGAPAGEPCRYWTP